MAASPINIPRIAGIDPKVAKILEPIKLAIENLAFGGGRAIRISDVSSGLRIDDTGKLVVEKIVVPSVAPEIQRRIEALEAVQTDVSTLADELLGTARFGSLLAAGSYDAKTLTVNLNGHIAGLGVAVRDGTTGTTSDFIIQADRFAVVFPSPPWLASQAYLLGQYVTPTAVVMNMIYEVTTAGTTGSTEPTWPSVAGQTVTSGSVVFTARTIDERVPFVVGTVGGVTTVGIDGNLLVDGTIQTEALEAVSITTDKIAAGAVTADKIAANTITGDLLVANLVLANDVEITSPGSMRSGQTNYDTGVGWFLGYVSTTPVFSFGDSSANKITWDGTTLRVVGNVSGALDSNSLVGTIPPSNFDISTLGWVISCTFSATDADTVAWTSGTLTTAAGDSFSINAADTGDMTQRTYIFFDINVSVTDLQLTTTAADAVGEGRIMVAVAEDDTTTAFFQVFGGSGSFGVSSPVIPSYGPLANGDFETGDGTGWVADASWSVVSATLVTGTYGASIAHSTTGLRSEMFTVSAGERYLITCNAQRDGASLPDADLELSVRWYSSPDGSPNYSSVATANHSSAALQFLRLIVEVPASSPEKLGAQVVARNSFGTTGHWIVDNFFVTPIVQNGDIDLGSANGTIDLASQISGILTSAFAEAGLINANVTINADGTLSGAGTGQASLNSLPGTINLGSQVSGTLTTSFAAAGLINANVTVNADGTLSGAGGGQASLNSLPGAISAGQINANAVTTAKIAAGAVTAGKIDAGTITANEIAAATITGNRLAANTVTAANIAALTITAAEIAAAAITAIKIATGTITANEIAANTITAGQVALNTLTAANIAASTITSSRIAASTILGTNIAAGTITAVNLAAGTITANELAANAVTANTIASGAVTAAKLAVTIAYAGEIIIDPAGRIRSGQTDYNTGVGWYLGQTGGVPKFSIGNPAGQYMTWDGTNLTINGKLAFSSSFSMTLVEFPSSWNVNAVRAGNGLVTLNLIPLTTTLGAGGGGLTMGTIPAELRPSVDRTVPFNGLAPYSTVAAHAGVATVKANGQIVFQPFDVIASGGRSYVRIGNFQGGNAIYGFAQPTIIGGTNTGWPLSYWL